MIDIGTRLRLLADNVINDPELDDDAMARIHTRAMAEVDTIRAEQRWRETAHIHEASHDPIVSVVSEAEEVDASPFHCHDCGRELLVDRAGEYVLICPRVYGRRPPELETKDRTHAVECGRAR